MRTRRTLLNARAARKTANARNSRNAGTRTLLLQRLEAETDPKMPTGKTNPDTMHDHDQM